jgi:hypothetical protein
VKQVGPAFSKFVPEPIATRSAAIFNVLATMSTARSTPIPVPVANAVRSHISCTAAISGNVRSAV